MSFSPVPTKKPKNEANAGLREWRKVFPSTIISASKAPTKAPIIIPTGVKNIPTNIPTSVALDAALDPPEILVKWAGII